jgi:hypothetical protein
MDDLDITVSPLIKLLRGNTHFRKPKRTIGEAAIRRKSRKLQRSRKLKPIVEVPSAQLLDKSIKQKLPILYTGSLWNCSSEADVGKLYAEWWATARRKALRSVKNRKLSDDSRAALTRVLTDAGATSSLVLSSELVCRTAYQEMHRRIVSLVQASPAMEMAFITVISGDGETSHIKTDVELFRSQQLVAGTARAISQDFFGITELSLFNSHRHPEGGRRMQRHEHLLVWGEGVIKKAELIAVKHAKRFKPNFTEARIIDVRAVHTDSVNLCRIIAYMLKPSHKSMNWNPGKDGKQGHMNQSEKGDRFIRYLRLAQVRMMMTFEDATFAGGEGNRIRSEIIKYLRSIVENEVATGHHVVHPDAIASFWVDLMRDLSLPWNLPIIRKMK